MSSRPSSKAFTLIEMLIALALISTIVTMVYGTCATTSRSLDVYGSQMACCERSHLVLRSMARQLRCAYAAPARAQQQQAPSDLSGKRAAQLAVFRAEPFNPAGDILDFRTAAGSGGTVGLARAKYRYDRPRGMLYTCCELAAQGEQDPQTWRAILRGITSIELTFHDGRQWQTAWDSREAGRLPQAARVAFTITDESARPHSYRMTVPIVCHPEPRQRENNRPAERP